jgi:KDO2-lipid IV(A) lauroyltransferase
LSFKAGFIRFLTRIVRPGFSASCAAAVFRRLLRICPIRKKVARRNLEIVLPGKTAEERDEIMWRTYDNLVWTGIEFTVLQRNPSEVLDWMDVKNPEALDRDGGILVACHVGNWELAVAWAAQIGLKVTAIVRESADMAERGVIAEMRMNAGVRFISKAAPMTKALGVLKRNEFLAIMPDQHGGGEGVKAPLFGLETSTPRGAAVFAYLTKKPLIPVYTRRVAPFKHVMHFGGAIPWKDAGNRNETITDITRAVNREVESIIREAPDQWLAQHRRFREHY